MLKQNKKNPSILGRIWRKELDQQFANLPRNVEQEKIEIGCLSACFKHFADFEVKVVLSAFGYHLTFDGYRFIPEAEVSLLHIDKDFYLEIQTFFKTFEFTNSERAELWILRRAETAYFMKAKLVENYLLSLVVMIRTAKYRSEVVN